MITQKRKLGDVGEEKASRYLIAKGYAILERNYTTKFGEIDIIARKGDTLVFVEVKTMRAGGVLRPEENLTHEKLRKMQRAVQMYCAVRAISENRKWRMDAISVFINESDKESKEPTLNHIENINIS